MQTDGCKRCMQTRDTSAVLYRLSYEALLEAGQVLVQYSIYLLCEENDLYSLSAVLNMLMISRKHNVN